MLEQTGTPMTKRPSDLRRQRAEWRPAAVSASGASDGVSRADTARGEMFTRASTVRSTLEFLGEAAPDSVAPVLAALTPSDRKVVRSAADTDEIPYRIALAVWRAADACLGPSDPQWIERSGTWAIERAGMRLYSGLIKKPSPQDFLTQQISLFHLYYRPGDMVVVDQAPRRAVMRLVGFEPGDRLFCRRMTGGWVAALRIAGGKDVTSAHNRCTMDGDAFCEWELQWR
jgi:hypothetical protein